MARQYLAEGLKGSFPFIADRKSIVVENLPDGRSRARIPGRLSVCDETNGNGRRYGKPVWEKNLQPDSILMKAISENAAFGLLEHPKDGQVNLNSPISHLVTEAKLQKGVDSTGKEIWEVRGEITILNPHLVPEAGRLMAMIEAGYNPRVSSRGFGSLVRSADGIDDVQEDYVCEGWDVVMKPSFETAILNPQRESTQEAAKPAASSSPAPAAAPTPAPISETAVATPAATATQMVPAPSNQPATTTTSTPGVTITLETERGSQAPTSGGSAPPVKQTNESSQNTTMNLNEIKSQITTLRGLEPSRLKPTQFAEGMSQLGALHQEVANYVAEDAKRSWQGQQLHDEIKSIENTWAESQLAPGKRATKLEENNTKLMQVVKAVAQAGIQLKGKLGESIRQASRQSALLNEVVERGQAWRQRSKAMESEAVKYRRRFMMASEALQQLATKYKADVTELGKRVIQLEFNEKANTPEIQKLLKECAKPKDLVHVRAVLEGKVSPEAGKPATGAPAGGRTRVNESTQNGKKPAAPANGSPTAPVSEGVTILSAKPNDPREINEAIGMVKRLSGVTG